MKKNNRIKIYKRNFFTLLEILISLALVSTLLTILISFFIYFNDLSVVSDKSKREIFQKKYAEKRIMQIFQDLAKESADNGNRLRHDFLFFTEKLSSDSVQGETLVLTYNNREQFHVEGSNRILARLYIDKKGHLSLMTWASSLRDELEGKRLLAKEELLDSIKDIKFHFLVYQDPEGKVIDPKEIGAAEELIEPYPPGEWRTSWPVNFKERPILVKIILIQKKEAEEERKIVFAFPLGDRKMNKFIKLKEAL